MQRSRNQRNMRNGRFAIFAAVAGVMFGPSCGAFDPGFGPGERGAFYAEGDPPAGGAGDPQPAPTGPPRIDPPTPAAGGPAPRRTYPAAEFDAARRERDRERAARRYILSDILGVEVDDVEFIYDDAGAVTGVEGLDQIRARLTAGAQMSDPEQAEAFRLQITKPLQRKLEKKDREIAALTALVVEVAVEDRIREACRLEGAVDDDAGRYSDIVEVLRKRFKPVLIAEENRTRVEIQTLDETGQEIRGDDSEPLRPREIVKLYLDKKPKLRQSQFRPGPGAGGAGGNGSAGGTAPNRSARIAAAVQSATGVMPPSAAPAAARR